MGHTILTIFLPRSYCHTYSENPRIGFCLSTGRRTAHVTPSLSWSERCQTSFLQHCSRRNSPDLNPDDHNISSVGLMQEKVYRSRNANVNELEMCLIDEWGRFDQSITDAAIATSAHGAVISALVSVERGTL